MKIFNNRNSQNTIPKTVLLLLGLLVFNILLAQPTGGGTHPGADPMPVPIDGGILMAILAGGGMIAMLFKKKKKEDK